MTNSTIDSNQDSYLAIRAVLIQQDVHYLHEKIDRLEHLMERLADKNAENHLSLLGKVNSVECRVISRG
jgi:ribosome assembly protein YihI (activator of Der GTPase)